MKLLLAFFLLVPSFAFSPFVYGKDGDTQLARFRPWLADLKSKIEPGLDPETVADRLLGGTARLSAFNLQALGRLYSDQSPEFGALRRAFKGLEDAIGGFDMWNNVLDAAQSNGSSESELKRIRSKRSKAKSRLMSYLEVEGWTRPGKSARLRKIEKFLKKYDWPGASKDRDLVLGKLAKQLRSVDHAEFDLSVLEEGNGLHELRREIRWFLIQARVLNGLVTFAPESHGCPVESLEWLTQDPIAESKYSGLPESEIEKKPCEISRCLFLSMVWTVEELGKVKDRAETVNNIGEHSDTVPAQLQARAERAYRAMKDADTLGRLRDEIRSCQ